jgi:hypothetical protein
MTAFVAAGAGFLAAVLWFDLMFDVQVRGHDGPQLPEDVLASIAAYYRRVTTTAHPMSRLIALVMAATLAAIVAQIAGGDDPRWLGWASLALAAVPIVLAGGRIVPDAVRLGGRTDDAVRQSALARSIFRGHVLCFAAITALLVLQLSAG